MSIQPYKVSVPETRLEDLKQRLSSARLPDEARKSYKLPSLQRLRVQLDDAGWDYGAPLQDVKRLVSFWKDGFDWKKVEARLNELPNYKASVPVANFGDIDLHFVHQTSTADAIPLLFCHGWVCF